MPLEYEINVHQLRDELLAAKTEIAYLRLLLWKMISNDLAKQHNKYERWLGKIHVQDMPR